VRKLKGVSGKFKERENNDDKEEYLSINMETKIANEEIEDNHKEKLDLEEEDIYGEVNLEEEIVSALEEIDILKGREYKAKKAIEKT
jgi:hypothetical protein